MINKKVSTIAGSTIILAIAIALGFSFFSKKENELQNQNNIVLNSPNLENKKEAKQNEEKNNKINNKVNSDNSQSSFVKNIYKNPKYNFQITIPDDWKIKEYNDDKSDPVFTFYKDIPNTDNGEVLAASLFTEGTFAIVRPNGQSTSGIPGKTLPSKIRGLENIEIASDYVLKNKSIWATLIKFNNNPESWEESGFIFGRNIIKNETRTCVRNDKIIDKEKCDLWNGDTIIYDGHINESDRNEVEKILSSFKFIP